MNAKPTTEEHRRFEVDVLTNSVPGYRDSVVHKAELLQECPAQVDEPQKRKVAVKIRRDVDCKTLIKASHIVKVPIEMLIRDQAAVIEVPICPGSRTNDVMELLQQHIPNLERLELWTYPNQIALCKHANVFDLVIRHGQSLQLRRKLGFFARWRQQSHDRECGCHPH